MRLRWSRCTRWGHLTSSIFRGCRCILESWCRDWIDAFVGSNRSWWPQSTTSIVGLEPVLVVFSKFCQTSNRVIKRTRSRKFFCTLVRTWMDKRGRLIIIPVIPFGRSMETPWSILSWGQIEASHGTAWTQAMDLLSSSLQGSLSSLGRRPSNWRRSHAVFGGRRTLHGSIFSWRKHVCRWCVVWIRLMIWTLVIRFNDHEELEWSNPQSMPSFFVSSQLLFSRANDSRMSFAVVQFLTNEADEFAAYTFNFRLKGLSRVFFVVVRIQRKPRVCQMM